MENGQEEATEEVMEKGLDENLDLNLGDDANQLENEDSWYPPDEELQDWYVLGEHECSTESTQITLPKNGETRKKPGTSIFFTSTLFQDTKSKLYNAIRGLNLLPTKSILNM